MACLSKPSFPNCLFDDAGWCTLPFADDVSSQVLGDPLEGHVLWGFASRLAQPIFKSFSFMVCILASLSKGLVIVSLSHVSKLCDITGAREALRPATALVKGPDLYGFRSSWQWFGCALQPLLGICPRASSFLPKF